MAELDVSATFLITIGRGAGPETWVLLSVSHEDGSPVLLDFPGPNNPSTTDPVTVFVGLSAMFGVTDLPLRVTEVQAMPSGFYGLRVEGTDEFDRDVSKVSPSTLGIVVAAGSDRGQALACDCGVAGVSSWFGDRTREKDG
jgi:hypothetical protein